MHGVYHQVHSKVLLSIRVANAGHQAHLGVYYAVTLQRSFIPLAAGVRASQCHIGKPALSAVAELYTPNTALVRQRTPGATSAALWVLRSIGVHVIAAHPVAVTMTIGLLFCQINLLDSQFWVAPMIPVLLCFLAFV